MKLSSCYQTTVGQLVPTEDIIKEIIKSIIQDRIDTVDLNVKVGSGKYNGIFLTGFYPTEANIKSFTHPISVIFKDKSYVCTDMRMYVTQVKDPHNITKDDIRNQTEYNFQKSRAILNMIWLDGGVERLRGNLKFAQKVYGAWISESISKIFNVDMEVKMKINVIAQVFYLNQFIDDKLTMEYKEIMAESIARLTNYGATFVFDVIDQIQKLDDISDLARTIVDVTKSTRLKDLTGAVLLTAVGNSWFGTNAKEIIAASIEFIPSWMSLLYTVMKERFYQNSYIAKIGEANARGGLKNEYLHNYEEMIMSNISVESIQDEFYVRPF